MMTLPRLACLLIFSFTVGAVAATARSPEETLVAFVSAVKEDGLVASVRFIHPEELATFRQELEPEIIKKIRSGRTREQFAIFTDPYNRKELRPFKDDADFVAIFIKWMSTSGMVGVTTFDHASVKPLGTVSEGELRHVVARFTYRPNRKPGEKDNENENESDDRAGQTHEVVSVTTMKMDGGQPMLMLLPELKGVANLMRQHR